MAGFWDFLSNLVSSKKGKDSSSVIVKNYISGNNNQIIMLTIEAAIKRELELINLSSLFKKEKRIQRLSLV